jgi:hypothetical protein
VGERCEKFVPPPRVLAKRGYRHPSVVLAIRGYGLVVSFVTEFSELPPDSTV